VEIVELIIPPFAAWYFRISNKHWLALTASAGLMLLLLLLPQSTAPALTAPAGLMLLLLLLLPQSAAGAQRARWKADVTVTVTTEHWLTLTVRHGVTFDDRLEHHARGRSYRSAARALRRAGVRAGRCGKEGSAQASVYTQGMRACRSRSAHTRERNGSCGTQCRVCAHLRTKGGAVHGRAEQA
jgi:hypothetical protein